MSNTAQNTAAQIETTITITVTLKSENLGDLECISGIRDADGEPVAGEFCAPGSNVCVVTFADDAAGTVEDRITDALEADNNVVEYVSE